MFAPPRRGKHNGVATTRLWSVGINVWGSSDPSNLRGVRLTAAARLLADSFTVWIGQTWQLYGILGNHKLYLAHSVHSNRDIDQYELLFNVLAMSGTVFICHVANIDVAIIGSAIDNSGVPTVLTNPRLHTCIWLPPSFSHSVQVCKISYNDSPGINWELSLVGSCFHRSYL